MVAMPLQREALERYRQGWALVQLYPGSKQLANLGWRQHSYQSEGEVVKAFWEADPERNMVAPNLGVVLGQRSGRLVVVDLDAVEPAIVALALPATDLRDGRASTPDSHTTPMAIFRHRVRQRPRSSASPIQAGSLPKHHYPLNIEGSPRGRRTNPRL
jgi:hypothetical protein